MLLSSKAAQPRSRLEHDISCYLHTIPGFLILCDVIFLQSSLHRIAYISSSLAATIDLLRCLLHGPALSHLRLSNPEYVYIWLFLERWRSTWLQSCQNGQCQLLRELAMTP
jgi:hypothetical protein